MNNRNKIAIIGAGQLGSRHLQALSLLSFPIDIWVIDPVQDSIKISKARWEEVSGNSDHAVYFHDSISMLPRDIDVAIIATGSLVRRKVTEALLQTSKVRFLILEKVLFPVEEDYNIIGELLQEKGVKAWVNCPRRQYLGYQNLKELLKDQPFFMTVQGSQWGLACNSIHWLDLFAFLNNDLDIQITPFLDEKVMPSKRQGFVEFSGALYAKNVKGSSVVINCFPSGNHPLECRIEWPSGSLDILESQEVLKTHLAEKGWAEESMAFPILRQSQLTNQVVEQLLATGNTSLTPYHESHQLHLPLIKLFLSHFNSINQTPENLICPIT